MGKNSGNSIFKKIQQARTQSMLVGLSVMSDNKNSIEYEEALDEFLSPKRHHIAKLSDEDLTSLIASESSSRYLHHLAASVLRSREAWRGPARWALIISGLSFLTSAFALIMSFSH